jgi:hypothetical protein
MRLRSHIARTLFSGTAELAARSRGWASWPIYQRGQTSGNTMIDPQLVDHRSQIFGDGASSLSFWMAALGEPSCEFAANAERDKQQHAAI